MLGGCRSNLFVDRRLNAYIVMRLLIHEHVDAESRYIKPGSLVAHPEAEATTTFNLPPRAGKTEQIAQKRPTTNRQLTILLDKVDPNRLSLEA